MSERRMLKASRMTLSEAWMSAGSMEGLVVEVARSMTDDMKDSATAVEDDRLEQRSASTDQTMRWMSSIHWER
jgi:hypothetical protein